MLAGKERSCDVDVAEAVLVDWVESQNFWLDWVYENSIYHVAHLYLRDSGGQFLVNGMGKGKNYRLGSLAEAIEHYFGGRELETDHRMLTAQNIADQTLAKNCGLLTSLNEFASELVPTIDYFPYSSSTQPSLSIPLVLVNPWLDHHSSYSASPRSRDFLCRYSYSTGTALGLNLDDALLHALNEQIERHYLSELYLKILGLEHTLRFDEVRQDSMGGLNKYLAFLTQEYRWKLILGRGMAGVFFCLAVGRSYNNSAQPMSVFGSGASLHKDVAMERAVTELIQGHFCVSKNTIKQDVEVKQALRQHGRFRQLIYIEDYLFDSVTWAQVEDQAVYSSTREQVDHLRGWLAAQQHPVYYRVKTPPDHSFVVVSTFVPGLERFHLLREGSLVAPQSWLRRYA